MALKKPSPLTWLVIVALAGAAAYHWRNRLDLSFMPSKARVLGGAEDCGRIVRGSSEKPDRAGSRAATACMLEHFAKCSPARVKIVNKWDDSAEVDHFEADLEILESQGETCWVQSDERSNVKDSTNGAASKHCRKIEVPAVGTTTAGQGPEADAPEDLVASDCPEER